MILLMSDFHEGIVFGLGFMLFLGAVIYSSEREDEDDFLNWRK